MDDNILTLDSFNFQFNEPRKEPDLSSFSSLKLASVVTDYHPKQIFEDAHKIFNTTITNEEKDILSQHAIPVNKEGNLFSLDDSKRNLILKTFGSAQEIKDLLSKKEVTKPSTITQKIFEGYVNGQHKPLDEQTLPELVATFNVSKWLNGTQIEVPSEKDILTNIRHKERLAPFRKLTANFKGRVAELSTLRDYVDWLPKDSLTQTIANVFRNIIDWHSKPPLMIRGVGGVGKSTLIAKFILDHVDHQKGLLPFVFLDFDRPGLSLRDPMALVIEAMRQLANQFASHAEIFENISNEIGRRYRSNITSKLNSNTRKSDRSILYELYLKQRDKVPDVPVLIVLDSFEEIQYRASSSDILFFFSFLEEISSQIPRIRFVFVGRSELRGVRKNFTTINLTAFDKDSACGYLESYKIGDRKTLEFIFNSVGGHPLSLQLAADLIHKAMKDHGRLLKRKEVEALFVKLKGKRVQEELVRRNLDHIHDDDVRKLAVPGIVVRKISPEIIKDVLAGPCGLGNITLEKASTLFEDIKKETFLINEENGILFFSKELRGMLYDLIVQKEPDKTQQVHDLAVKYYDRREGQTWSNEQRAEYLYHRLKRGDDPVLLEEHYTPELQSLLESTLTELPNDAYLVLSRLMNVAVSDESRSSANQLEWEKSISTELSNYFQTGDDYYVEKLNSMLASRHERLAKSPLPFNEGKFLLRQGKFNEALKVVNRALSQAPERDRQHVQLLLLRSNIFEYQLDFTKAYEHILQAHDYAMELDSNTLSFVMSGEPVLVEVLFALVRLTHRLQKPSSFETDERIIHKLALSTSPSGSYQSIPITYRKHFTEITYRAGINRIQHSFNVWLNSIYTADNFREKYFQYQKSFKDNAMLDKYINKMYGGNVFLKDISEPGVFNVALCDFIFYLELTNVDLNAR